VNYTNSGINRFIKAQESSYQTALSEIKRGRKTSHWMWYIFPQIVGLGKSGTAVYYGIRDLNEAEEYLQNPILGERLIEISEVLLTLQETNATAIFGSTDNKKLKSCMTLFSKVDGAPDIFSKILDKYFNGQPDNRTLYILYGSNKN